jgi:hypothetical protein
MHAIRTLIFKDALTSIDCPLPDSEKKSRFENYTSVSIRLPYSTKLKFKAIMIHFKLSGFGLF